MTKMEMLPMREVAGSAATSIARFELILRNLREKRAGARGKSGCVAHFLLRKSTKATKNTRTKTLTPEFFL
jgi:hypothetical protein